jgi:hypothetical protein
MAQTHTYEYLLAGKRIRVENKSITPTRAIRIHCIDCSGGSMADARNCEIETCPLWPYRMGKNPRSLQTNEPAGHVHDGNDTEGM